MTLFVVKVVTNAVEPEMNICLGSPLAPPIPEAAVVHDDRVGGPPTVTVVTAHALTLPVPDSPTYAVDPSTKIALGLVNTAGVPQVSVTVGGVPANVQPVTVWPP